MSKIIFVAGGVMSGIGKGIATSSIGKILQSKGFKVTAVKIDPYVNVDAGTMDPIEHGETFVTDDAVECDQDIGNYERFLSEDLSEVNYMTTGKVYLELIQKERAGHFKGKCVEVVPHLPNEVISRIERAGRKSKADFVLVEIGGTVGEYQNLIFLEAARILRLRSPKRVLFILVSYLPVPSTIGEMKTKPTQTAVRTLNEAGIQPDIIMGRAPYPLDGPRKEKISTFCNIDVKDVISAPDCKLIYEIPLNFEEDNIGNRILGKFGMRAKKRDFSEWQEFIKTIKRSTKPIKIGVVSKNLDNGSFTVSDAHLSVDESIKYASWKHLRKPEIEAISSFRYEKNPSLVKELSQYDAVVFPEGFGSDGRGGVIDAIRYCREEKIPLLAISLGMELALIEVVGELKQGPIIIEEERRIGSYLTKIEPGTISARSYKKSEVSERHRSSHRLNPSYIELLESKGVVVAGTRGDSVDIVEMKEHPFFVATSFRPEFKSRPMNPHPLFDELIKVAIKRNRSI